MNNKEQLQGLLDDMEAAMHKLEGWTCPLELHVAMQTVYSAWSLMHSAALHARSVAEELDADMQSVWVPRGTAVEAQKYAKNLTRQA